MAKPTILHCKCVYCGFEWEFTARSKADAARMTGPPVCERSECRDKATESIYALLKEEGISKAEKVDDIGDEARDAINDNAIHSVRMRIPGA